MANTPLKNRLLTKPYLMGTFVFSTDPQIPLMLAEAGFDFAIVDTEHGMNDIRTVENHLRACQSVGLGCMVRLGRANLADAPRLLDAGVDALMFPHLGLAGSGVAETLRSMKYWPEGDRPTCTGTFSGGYGLPKFSERAEQSNRNVLSVGLVEDEECLSNIDKVFSESAVDWVMPGPGDLATSMGLHGQLTHPKVTAAVEQIMRAAKSRGLIAGAYVNDASEVARWQAAGARFFVYSIDYKIFAKSVKAVIKDCHEALGKASTTSLAS